ncbi:MAG: alpha/beta fold hydrolase, partial [Parasphingorhabdus sp.]|uniref:alpha/beta hydrolase n=1 Tax=Parasphingorhabdus sp. TaxID=2709688 RepID=UPI00329709A0
FTLAGQKEFSGPDPFLHRVRQKLAQNPAESDEIVLFVHGYNTTQAETAFRAAQFAYDINLPGALMIYSWPSQGKLLGYAYDSESMLFARDGLEKVLRRIRGSGIKKLSLIGHSMGSALIMETLRQMEIEDPGWSKRSLTGVVLISPDLDVDLFHSQMSRFAEVPDPFIILTSGKDPVLGLSALLRGDRDRRRLGNINGIDEIADLPVHVIDTTAYSKSASSAHFVAGTSPALLAIFGEAQRMVDTFGTEQIIRDNLLAGDVVRVQKATGIRLTPTAASPN